MRVGLCSLFLVFSSVIVHAQGLGNSPYSALGMGELYGNALAPNLAMGGAGVSTANGFYINALNPALLVRNKFTTFDVGVLGKYHVLQDKSQSQKEFAGNLGYLALSFPASKNWSLGLSLQPYSYINYQQKSFSKIGTSIYEAVYNYDAKGGFNTLNFTNGFSIGKYLNVGVEASFLFGGYKQTAQSQLKIGDGNDYLVSHNEQFNVSDILLRVGAAWQQPIKKEKYINFGITYDLKSKLSGKKTTTFNLSDEAATPISNPDTLQNLVGSSLVTLPQAFRVGISYEKLYNVVVSLDYHTQAWSNFLNSSGKSDGLRNNSSYHLGVEYMPKFTSSKYYQLIWYRAGLSYTQTPFVISNKPINDMNVSLGLGLPVGSKYVNMVNLTLVAGQRGEISDNTFVERYLKIAVGLSLKDSGWFQKFKVD